MIEVAETEKYLKSMLNEAGFTCQKPDFEIALNVIREFAKVEVNCTNDGFLFQCGVYDFTGTEIFYWDIVRQFEIEGDDGDWMEQLHFEVTFKPNSELKNFEIEEWSFDYEDLEEYFQKIRNLKEYKIPIENYRCQGISIYQEEVQIAYTDYW